MVVGTIHGCAVKPDGYPASPVQLASATLGSGS